MGLLFTTPGTPQPRHLNTAFDGPGKGLDFIRANAGPRILAKVGRRNWAPGHLARMLRLLPFDQATGSAPAPNETKRWWWFLRKLLGGNSAAFDSLRNALADAILNKDSNGVPLKIIRVSFDHVELDVPPDANVVIFDSSLPSGDTVRHITLFTKAVPAGSQDNPPTLGGDEQDFPVKPPWEKP